MKILKIIIKKRIFYLNTFFYVNVKDQDTTVWPCLSKLNVYLFRKWEK